MAFKFSIFSRGGGKHELDFGLQKFRDANIQWRRQGVGVGGQNIRGLGDGSPPLGSRGEAPVGGLGDEVPQKLKRFCKLMY